MQGRTWLTAFAVLMLVVLANNKLPVQAEDEVVAILKVLEGETAVVVDEVRRRKGRLTVSTDSVGRARFEIEAELTADEAISEARIRVWPEGKSKPELDATVKMGKGSLRWGRTGEESRTIAVPRNTLIYIPPSATAMEQTIRHAVRVRGKRDKVALKVWSPFMIEEVNDAEVRFRDPDTAELSLFGATYTLAIDAEGNILNGRVEPQGNTIIRE